MEALLKASIRRIWNLIDRYVKLYASKEDYKMGGGQQERVEREHGIYQ